MRYRLRNTWIPIVFVTAAGPVFGAPAPKIRVGDKAPPLTIEHLLQAPPSAMATWEAFQGQVVVLEFWATWCSPCISAMPHLNELAEKYRDRPVRFVSVTDEPLQVIDGFLKNRTIAGWVGIDKDKSTLKAFGLKTRPSTFLVNGSGVILAIVNPNWLTEEMIDNALAGRPVEAPLWIHGAMEFPDPATEPTKDSPQPSPGLSGKDPQAGQQGAELSGGTIESDTKSKTHVTRPPSTGDALLEIRVRSTQAEQPNLVQMGNRMEAEGWTIRDAVAHAYDVSPTRVVGPPDIDATRYGFDMTVPSDRGNDISTLLRNALGVAFGLTVTREARELDVIVMTKTADRDAIVRGAGGRGSAKMQRTSGHWRATNQTMDALAREIEKVTGQPVINETGLAGAWTFELRYVAISPESLHQAFEAQLGLKLSVEKRRIEAHVVEIKEPTLKSLER